MLVKYIIFKILGCPKEWIENQPASGDSFYLIFCFLFKCHYLETVNEINGKNLIPI